jgi:hypothetical protein
MVSPLYVDLGRRRKRKQDETRERCRSRPQEAGAQQGSPPRAIGASKPEQSPCPAKPASRARMGEALGRGGRMRRTRIPRRHRCGERQAGGGELAGGRSACGSGTTQRAYACADSLWQGRSLAVPLSQLAVRLTRSFDKRSHLYLGYSLKVRRVGSEAREFLAAVRARRATKHYFQAAATVSGGALPVPDARPETVDFYKVHKLKVRPPETVDEVTSRRGPEESRSARPPRIARLTYTDTRSSSWCGRRRTIILRSTPSMESRMCFSVEASVIAADGPGFIGLEKFNRERSTSL